VLKSHAGREEGAFLAQHPNLRRTPKNKRAEIKEQVQQRLLTMCLPVPSIVDVVWDQKSGILTLFSLGGKVIERFEELFRKSFEGFQPCNCSSFCPGQDGCWTARCWNPWRRPTRPIPMRSRP